MEEQVRENKMGVMPVNRLLHVLHLTGPLIRITGLIVAAVAVQMVLSGTGEWLALMGPTR